MSFCSSFLCIQIQSTKTRGWESIHLPLTKITFLGKYSVRKIHKYGLPKRPQRTILGKCGRLTLVGCQMPTKPLSHSPSLAWQGKKVRWKSSWVETRTGRSLTSYLHQQDWLNLGKINLVYRQLKIEWCFEKKTKPKNKNQRIKTT